MPAKERCTENYTKIGVILGTNLCFCQWVPTLNFGVNYLK